MLDTRHMYDLSEVIDLMDHAVVASARRDLASKFTSQGLPNAIRVICQDGEAEFNCGCCGLGWQRVHSPTSAPRELDSIIANRHALRA
jgi:hypothetical protein